MNKVFLFLHEVLRINIMKLFALRYEDLHNDINSDITKNSTGCIAYSNKAKKLNKSKLNKLFGLIIDCFVVVLAINQAIKGLLDYFNLNTENIIFTINIILGLLFAIPWFILGSYIVKTKIANNRFLYVLFLFIQTIIFAPIIALHVLGFPAFVFIFIFLLIWSFFANKKFNKDNNSYLSSFYNINLVTKVFMVLIIYFILFLPYYQLPIHIVWQGMFFVLGFFNNTSSVSLLLLLESFKPLNLAVMIYFSIIFNTFWLSVFLNVMMGAFVRYNKKIDIFLQIVILYSIAIPIIFVVYPWSFDLIPIESFSPTDFYSVIQPFAIVLVIYMWVPNKSVIIRHFSTISLLKFLKIILLWYAVSFFVIILCLVAGYVLDEFFIDTASDFWQNNVLISTFKHKIQTYTLQDWLYKF